MQQRADAPTLAFIDYLKAQPLLKAVLCGHTHFFWQERFSPTATQIVCPGTYAGEALESYFAASLAETGKYTRIGGWWDRKGENEIDIIAENELEREVEFYEAKRNRKNISLAVVESKRDAFLRSTGQYAGWRTRCRPLSMEDM